MQMQTRTRTLRARAHTRVHLRTLTFIIFFLFAGGLLGWGFPRDNMQYTQGLASASALRSAFSFPNHWG